MKSNRFFLLCLSLLLAAFVPAFSWAQTEADLEKKQKEQERLKKELETVQRLLGETEKEKSRSWNDVKLLIKQMEIRQGMIAGIGGELKMTESEIDRTLTTIEALEEEIRDIQTEFGRLAKAVYLGMHPHNESFYFFSAGSLLEGYYEIMYFREFADYLRRQVKLIRKTRQYLATEKEYLEEIKANKETLFVQQKSEMENLKVDKKEKDKVYKELKKKEEDYKKSLKEKANRMAALNTEIEKLIRDLQKKSGVGGESDMLLPLSKEFRSNKGKFPWPVPSNKGIITTHFGRQQFEGTDVEIDINGIDITTSKAQQVRAIFGGTVEQVKKVPFHGSLIIISHGGYFTLYSNLESVLVEKGAQVKALENIGIARTDKTSGETSVHLEIYQGTTPVNPEEWLVSK